MSRVDCGTGHGLVELIVDYEITVQIESACMWNKGVQGKKGVSV